jgi:hypothetical protein
MDWCPRRTQVAIAAFEVGHFLSAAGSRYNKVATERFQEAATGS